MAAKRKTRIDSVRASRDGHEFHEAWTARKALQLLWPDGGLTGIAVEGLSPTDHANASASTVEIADLALYYGGVPTFVGATQTTLAQFKYSIADKVRPFGASDAKKTVEKFAKAFREYKKKYGAQAVTERLNFQLVTNRPISAALSGAICALANGVVCKGDTKNQAEQLRAASGLSGKPLAQFAGKLAIVGHAGTLSAAKRDLASLLVDWSATGDSIAAGRLGKLRDMVRDKAGYTGTNQNLITRIDILAALGVGDPKDLLPCEPRLPNVGIVLQREQLTEAIGQISTLSRPLLVQAAGGVGKTVFLEALANKLAESHEVVFFDCFGGGAYRSPEDARHLPKKGLIHIANSLAFRGHCDPMLPDSNDVQGLLATFRRRIVQCLATLGRAMPGRKLALLLDAIDNADIVARQNSEDCFPTKLLESLDADPIDGLIVVASCRPERKPATYARCEDFFLQPFTKSETTSFLRARLKGLSHVEIDVAHARSGGNPRVLDYLVKGGRGLFGSSEIDEEIELDDLIQRRLSESLALAIERGYQQKDLDAFLAGLAVLPPPVPLDEYASAHGLALDAVHSFASDMHPLLERTNQGLTFRDEPTETLVRNQYASHVEPLRRVATNLMARQDVSVYAARALPGLLHQLGDGEQLFSLAFDDRIPTTIKSTVGKRNVRYARLKAAMLYAAVKKNYNNLVRLLVELSTIAAVDQRGGEYIFEHPELVVASNDVDARRRLFESRAAWPGSRHARLAIANVLSGETEEASRHAHLAGQWIDHKARARRDDGPREAGPERADIAAIPFFLVSQGRQKDAAKYLERWRDWYSYEVSELVFGYSKLAQMALGMPLTHLDRFTDILSTIGTIAGALSFQELSNAKRKALSAALAKLCKKRNGLQFPDSYHRDSTYQLQDGLRKSAAIALSLRQYADSIAIAQRVPHERPRLWAFRSGFQDAEVFAYLFYVSLRAATRNESVHEKDLLPQELWNICARISRSVTGKDFVAKAKDKVTAYAARTPKKSKDASPSNSFGHDDKQNAERFLDRRLGSLLGLAKALCAVLTAPTRRADNAYCQLIEAWDDCRKSRDPYHAAGSDLFFQLLGFRVALFALWCRSDLTKTAAKRFLSSVHRGGVDTHNLVRIVAILAQRPEMHSLAGEEAIYARGQVENEDDVTVRASLFGALARAILPASAHEASAYFTAGLEQLEAIGSGDYQFTNELLLFASEMKGDELEERDAHTLTNICELNMGGEPEKFFWGAYGRGMAKAAGIRGLAKLSRWDDRSKVALENTLLPYLIGLLEHGKIKPADALSLNRLANPVEYFYAGTKEFAAALRQHAGPSASIIGELISQFQDDNPSLAADSTIETLASMAKEVFGSSSAVSKRLSAARVKYAETRNHLNEKDNYKDADQRKRQRDAEKRKSADAERLKRIAAATNPVDKASLGHAISALDSTTNAFGLKDAFFKAIRKKVRYGDRANYVRNIASLEDFFFYWKLAELKEAKRSWEGSSAGLALVYEQLAGPLLNMHIDDLIDDGRLSGSKITELSDLTGAPIPELTIELIKSAARYDSTATGSLWLACATFICSKAGAGQGQAALSRLLNSEAAILADSVTDGPWTANLGPPEDFAEVAAGLIWRVLGSATAIDRWRGAHCMRSFAKFGRWDIIDRVVARIGDTCAGPFQARELNFYYLHARLWLLIALARIAHDFPAQIAKYNDTLLSIVLEDENPHVLMQHFASHALCQCLDAGEMGLPPNLSARVRNVNCSPYRRLKEKIRNGADFYSGRPKDVPEPSSEFHLEYDFHKHDVDRLAAVFGQPCWKIADLVSEVVHQIDPRVDSMHDSGGREARWGSSYAFTNRYHSYGQHLGWHGLLLAAGKLLRGLPITDDYWYDEDPWGEWFRRYGLTRDDGLWLSDGTDRTPLDIKAFLLERKGEDFAITGKQDRLLALIGLQSRARGSVAICGRWFSSDEVRVNISSALVPPRQAAVLARQLTREDPMSVSVPYIQYSGEDPRFVLDESEQYTPWLLWPNGESGLDEDDPYGIVGAAFRPRLLDQFVAKFSLSKEDSFGRVWRDKRGRIALAAQTWGRLNRESEVGSGTRLLCSRTALKDILSGHQNDLLILINLQRYEKETYNRASTWTHTVAVVRITRDLSVQYFKGCINQLHKSRF